MLICLRKQLSAFRSIYILLLTRLDDCSTEIKVSLFVFWHVFCLISRDNSLAGEHGKCFQFKLKCFKKFKEIDIDMKRKKQKLHLHKAKDFLDDDEDRVTCYCCVNNMPWVVDTNCFSIPKSTLTLFTCKVFLPNIFISTVPLETPEINILISICEDIFMLITELNMYNYIVVDY